MDTGSGSREPTVDEKKAALAAVLETATFRRSAQLGRFLRFICEKETAGRADDISEYVIGTEVLGRPPAYSTSEDSFVRRRAVDLREKLDEVYASELRRARVRIELPRGRYIPRFVLAARSAAEAAPFAALAEAAFVPPPATLPALAARTSRWRPFVAGMLVGGAIVAAGFLARRSEAPGPPTISMSDLYEAEGVNARLEGRAVANRCGSCSGGGRVRQIGGLNHVAFHDIHAPTDGVYQVEVLYRLKGARHFTLRVNDDEPIDLPLAGDEWSMPARIVVGLTLQRGANKIVFGSDKGAAPDLDAIGVARVPSYR